MIDGNVVDCDEWWLAYPCQPEYELCIDVDMKQTQTSAMSSRSDEHARATVNTMVEVAALPSHAQYLSASSGVQVISMTVNIPNVVLLETESLH
jgi:hypothetical protein